MYHTIQSYVYQHTIYTICGNNEGMYVSVVQTVSNLIYLFTRRTQRSKAACTLVLNST